MSQATGIALRRDRTVAGQEVVINEAPASDVARPADRRFGAWIRNGDPLDDDQIAFAIENYRAAILQPWETAALECIKSARPDMTVLCYKCLSSTRSDELGPIYASGVSYLEASREALHWFAHRSDGSRIEWDGYPFHWQMAVWDPGYQERWCDNISAELEGTLWDGVMADNDVYDDYYGLNLPIEGGRTMDEIRCGLDELVQRAGRRLNAINKMLVPNIAESRREPGRWARHSKFGGGFDEVWLAWGPDDYLNAPTAFAQSEQVAGPGFTIMRTATDGTNEHRNFTYGLAAFWIFGGGSGGAYSATGRDDHSGTPYIPQLNWDLGEPVEKPRRRGNGWSRAFTGGWAAANFNHNLARRLRFDVPLGLITVDGAPAPREVTLRPHEGVLYRGLGT